jgi:hypothetical protein
VIVLKRGVGLIDDAVVELPVDDDDGLEVDGSGEGVDETDELPPAGVSVEVEEVVASSRRGKDAAEPLLLVQVRSAQTDQVSAWVQLHRRA